MYACPRCRTAMGRSRSDDGVYWGCSACKGVWISATLVRRTKAGPYTKAMWFKANLRPGERPCAICARHMSLVRVPPVVRGGEEIELDLCDSCQFVWFDPGEFEQLPDVPRAPSTSLSPQARKAAATAQIKSESECMEVQPAAPDNSWQLMFALLGLPVELTSPAVTRRPWVTWGLAAAVTLVSILTFSNLESVVGSYALVPNDPFRHGGLTLLFSFFLHGGVLHLLSNMYFLLIFGDNVEDHLGAWKYAALIVLAAVAGDAAHILLDPSSHVPVVGASGGISGIIAFYALAFPRAKIGMLFIIQWIAIPAWGAFGLWLLLQAAGVGMQLAGFSNVSAVAHLGGALVGFVFWLLWRKGNFSP